MAKTKGTKQLRELRIKAAAAAYLVRTFVPHLIKALFENLAIEDRIRARLSPPKRRTKRPLKIGAFAVGAAAAGVAAARLVGHRAPHERGPETDRA
jgi:hypothetical protein